MSERSNVTRLIRVGGTAGGKKELVRRGPPLQCAEADDVALAYLEFRPLQTDDGKWEFDARAYTENEAVSRFADLDDRLARCAADSMFMREIAWTDDQVRQFNQHRDAYRAMLVEAMILCGDFGGRVIDAMTRDRFPDD